jgi:putative FmdB family regulatory protein
MPLYEYQCPQCGRFELIKKFSDAPVDTCPTCGQPVQKLLSSPAIQFKGTGWYVTDYAKKPSGGGSKPDDSKKEGKKDGGTDGGGKTSDSSGSSGGGTSAAAS